jgi:hypothetical protein
VAPTLSYAQEVLDELLTAHADAETRRDRLTVLDSEEAMPDEFTERKDKNASERRGEELGQLAGDDPRSAALRIRELEIVATLAADSLREAGDEATGEIVRAVLERRPE